MSENVNAEDSVNQELLRDVGHYLGICICFEAQEYCEKGFIDYQGQHMDIWGYILASTTNREEDSFYMRYFYRLIDKHDAEHGRDYFNTCCDYAEQILINYWYRNLIIAIQNMGMENKGRLDSFANRLGALLLFPPSSPSNHDVACEPSYNPLVYQLIADRP